jgi:hypothetical protein
MKADALSPAPTPALTGASRVDFRQLCRNVNQKKGIKMSGTSTRSFEFLKAVQDKCRDHAEFDQVSYIKDALHDGLKGESIFAGGVCAALCVYTIADWIKNGTRKQTVDQYVSDCNPLNSSRPTLEPINDLSNLFDSKGEARGKALTQIKKATGKAPLNVSFEIKPSVAIETTTKFGPCFMAWGGVVNEGHAIICDGSKRALFDPNYGYYQTVDNANTYFWAFKTLVKLYPEYSTSAAITLYPFS